MTCQAIQVAGTNHLPITGNHRPRITEAAPSGMSGAAFLFLMKTPCGFERFVVCAVTILDDFGRIASDNGTWGNVLAHDSTSCHNGSLANGDITDNEHAIAQPHIVAYADGLLHIGVVVGDGLALVVVVLGNHHALGTRMEVVTDGNGTSSKDTHAIEVDIVA